jgi:hypothetical protein
MILKVKIHNSNSKRLLDLLLPEMAFHPLLAELPGSLPVGIFGRSL